MENLKRLKRAINWLIFQDVAENERALAELLGYTKSSFSQIVNGKVPMSDKFVKKLCRLDENINEVWLMTGEGSMFLNNNPISEETVSVPVSVWSVLQKQSESLSAKDRQVDALITMLQNELSEKKKMTARAEDDATSAAVG